MSSKLPTNDYKQILTDLKTRIREARLKAVLVVNEHLLVIYWEIGKVIAEQEAEEGWGAKTIERLSADLRQEFVDMKGLSPRNLRYMRDFYLAYGMDAIWQQPVAKLQGIENEYHTIWQQPVAKLPWGHHTVILNRAQTLEERIFYIHKCIENNWSREVLAQQISSNLYGRTGTSLNNFANTLPAPHSDLANATIKNPFVFDFLAMGEKMQERDLEKALMEHLKKFMLELGKGFAYVGNQFNLDVEGNDYFLDLLFYNTQMHCYVLFELKIGEFRPEFAGKLNFYINAVDRKIKGDEDKPTIGVLLCKTPNETVVKYALEGIKTPIGISEYKLADALPKRLKGEMPSIEELEKEIDEGYEELRSLGEKRFDTLKAKFAEIKGAEIKLTYSDSLIGEIVDKSCIILYESIVDSMKKFEDLFVSYENGWSVTGGFETITNPTIMAAVWKIKKYHHQSVDRYFLYNFNGLKKSGTQGFNIVCQLNFEIDTYWYGFTLTNLREPIVKKLYGEQLTQEDIVKITAVLENFVMDKIEDCLKKIEL